MSTDYNKWRKFDDDKYVAELEEQQELVGIFTSNSDKQQDQTRDILETSAKIQRRVELNESKKAVEELKAAGRQNRRRQKQISKSIDGSASALEATSSNTNGSVPPESVENSIYRFVEILSNLAVDVDKLQAFTEKKRLHGKGFQSSLNVLNGVELLLNMLPHIFQKNFCDEREEEDIRGSLETLLRQIFACQSLFAMSGGCFSISVDLTRILLTTDAYRHEAGFWIIRALSFAGMGSSYLCYLHLKTAQSFSPSYPGLETCISFFENDIHRQIGRENNGGVINKNFQYSKTVEREILRAVFISFHLQDNEEWLKVNPEIAMVSLTDIQLLLDADQYFSNKLQSFLSEGLFDFISGNSLLQWLDMDIVVSKVQRVAVQKHIYRSLPSLGLSTEEMKFNSTLFISIHLAHKLWSEAQLLYLEGLFASAEGKYVAAVTLLSETVSFWSDSNETKVYEGVNGVMSILLMNIGLCRSHRNQKYTHFSNIEENGTIFTLPLKERLEHLERLSPVEIYRLSFSLTKNPVCLWKEIEALQDAYRFDEALDALVTLRTLLGGGHFELTSQNSSISDGVISPRSNTGVIDSCDSWQENGACVVSLGNCSLLSQLYLMGKKHYYSLDGCCKPTTTSSDDMAPGTTESASLKNLHPSVLLSSKHFWSTLDISAIGFSSKPCKLSGMSSNLWQILLQSKLDHILYLKRKLGF